MNENTAELLKVLRCHASRYPAMQPCDIVKLIYQNEFGGGHLIRSKSDSLRRIHDEYARVVHDDLLPLREYIGNDVYRVNLAAINTGFYSLEQLNDDFVASSLRKGNIKSFISKLELLREHFNELSVSFGAGDLEEYLSAYAADGYPMVSHSAKYNELYHPAYRIVIIPKNE